MLHSNRWIQNQYLDHTILPITQMVLSKSGAWTSKNSLNWDFASTTECRLASILVILRSCATWKTKTQSSWVASSCNWAFCSRLLSTPAVFASATTQSNWNSVKHSSHLFLTESSWSKVNNRASASRPGLCWCSVSLMAIPRTFLTSSWPHM